MTTAPPEVLSAVLKAAVLNLESTHRPTRDAACAVVRAQCVAWARETPRVWTVEMAERLGVSRSKVRLWLSLDDDLRAEMKKTKREERVRLIAEGQALLSGGVNLGDAAKRLGVTYERLRGVLGLTWIAPCKVTRRVIDGDAWLARRPATSQRWLLAAFDLPAIRRATKARRAVAEAGRRRTV